MGLPKYLRNKYTIGDYDEFLLTYWGTENINKLIKYFYPGIEIEHDKSLISIFTPILQTTEQRSYPLYVLKQSTIKYGFRKMYKIAPCILNSMHNSDNDYKKVEVKWFTGWTKEDETWTWSYKSLKVNKYFFNKAQEYSYARRENEKRLIDLKEDIERIMNIEQGRSYYGRLRFLILERDKHKCVLCGRGTSEASLEVDHKVAWIDGGKTTYSNGQTVCTDCNKGKHHIKAYNKKLEEIKKINSYKI